MKLVYGLGLSGVAIAGLCEKYGYEYILYDKKTTVDPAKLREKIGSSEYERGLYLGEWPEKIEKDIDEFFLSPGVNPKLPEIAKLHSAGVGITGEIELANRYLKGGLVAITGTNGKTTTTTLTGKLFSDYFEDVHVVGNIGIPFTLESFKTTEKSYSVAEISSFQLETTYSFHPNVSMILNITEDHLDRHETMDNYIDMKISITKNQNKNDICVLNHDDPILREKADKIPARVVWFSKSEKLENGLYYEEPYIYSAVDGVSTQIIDVNELHIIGDHNYENAMASIAAALYYNIPLESIQKTLREFKPVEHRIEYVATKNGVDYYNDSKGTNPDAAIKAIRAMKKKTLLIGGGYDKHLEFDEWLEECKGRIKYLVLIGQTKEKIAECARKHGFDKEIVIRDTFEEAMTFCTENADPGEAVLLSPACASWGMFDNFEQRGHIFKDYVNSLK